MGVGQIFQSAQNFALAEISAGWKTCRTFHLKTSLELEFKRKLEVALRVCSEVGGRIDRASATTRIQFAAAEVPDESIGVPQQGKRIIKFRNHWV